MIELNGDLFYLAKTYKADLIVCTTNLQIKKNGCLVMGAGIAKQFRNRYPGIDAYFGETLEKLNPGIRLVNEPRLMIYFADDFKVMAMATKWHWKYPSKLKFVKSSLEELLNFVDNSDMKTIVMPRPGCGNGGLNWEEVKQVMMDLGYDNRFIVVHKD